LTATLPNFPTTEAVSFTVSVVDTCDLKNITAPLTITDKSYKVNDGNLTITPDVFTIEDSFCESPNYSFSFTAYDQTTIQSFLNYTASVVEETAFGTSGVIYATDPLLNEIYADINANSFAGNYTIKVTASTLWTTTNSLDINFSFNLEVSPDCTQETVDLPLIAQAN
jgi:hypothetical protein